MDTFSTLVHFPSDCISQNLSVPCTLLFRFANLIRAIEFIETSIFTRQIKEIATDDELKALQQELIAKPDAGALIVGTGGLRKIRMATAGKGKSGGSRVIYFIATEEVIYLVLAYPKSVKDSLTSAEKTVFKALTKQLKEEKH